MFGDAEYLAALVLRGRPAAPIIFYLGDLRLAERPGIGVCGSRAVSELGIKAARNCGGEVSRRGMVVISGYAKGVDTEAHLAALRSGGSTVIVLAEGFDHFRVKRVFARDIDPRRVLVLSQFPPSQPWQAHAAMARNALIFGLGCALVVIEAGAKGGTLAAGEGALRIGRPLLVLDFGHDSPEGNQLLIKRGGRPMTSVQRLARRSTDCVMAHLSRASNRCRSLQEASERLDTCCQWFEGWPSLLRSFRVTRRATPSGMKFKRCDSPYRQTRAGAMPAGWRPIFGDPAVRFAMRSLTLGD